MTFGFFLAAGPGSAGARRALALAREALARGHDVRIFLMEEGVRLVPAPVAEAQAADGPREFPGRELEALFLAGAEVSLCAQSARARGVAPVSWVYFGDQSENAHGLVECDRWMAFAG